MRRVSAVVPVVVLLLAVAGCSSKPAAEPTPTLKPIFVTGSVSVPPHSYFSAGMTVVAEGDTCTAKDGYDDVTSGSQIVISDAAGKTIALGALGGGSIAIPAGGVPLNARCQFPFTVQDVPPGGKFYGVHVGNTNRGTVQYTAKQLAAGPEVTVG